LPPCFF